MKTISIDCIFLKHSALVAALGILAGCGAAATPPCPYTGEPTRAPSAGCLSVQDGKMLVVQNLGGELNLPGGSSQDGEAAQCTAFRETWEETGLQLQPGELLTVFDTGFHLYECERHANSGEIDPPPRLEVNDAFYLAPEEFDNYEWRYGDQQREFEALIQAVAEPTGTQ